MGNLDQTQPRHARQAPHDLSPEQFRALGRQVVDQIADFLASLPGRPVAPGAAPTRCGPGRRSCTGSARLAITSSVSTVIFFWRAAERRYNDTDPTFFHGSLAQAMGRRNARRVASLADALQQLRSHALRLGRGRHPLEGRSGPPAGAGLLPALRRAALSYNPANTCDS